MFFQFGLQGAAQDATVVVNISNVVGLVELQSGGLRVVLESGRSFHITESLDEFVSAVESDGSEGEDEDEDEAFDSETSYLADFIELSDADGQAVYVLYMAVSAVIASGKGSTVYLSAAELAVTETVQDVMEQVQERWESDFDDDDFGDDDDYFDEDGDEEDEDEN